MGSRRIVSPYVTLTWFVWLLLALLIMKASAGTWAVDGPRIWAPLLVSPKDAARNVLVYVPFGILGMLALGRRDTRGVVRVAAIAGVFSLAVETLQLYTVDRVASVTDVVWAVAGAAVGAVGVRWLLPR